MIFTLMLTFILGFNTDNIPTRPAGQYVEIFNVQYEQSSNTTYGALVRYSVDPNGGKTKQVLQLRSCPGHCELAKQVVADPDITVIGK